MIKPTVRAKLISTTFIILLTLVLFSGCNHRDDLDDHINQATATYRFRLFNWEVKTLAGEFGRLFTPYRTTDNTTALEKQVESQIREALSERGGL